jgi:MSHA biogenesis protein MshP
MRAPSAIDPMSPPTTRRRQRGFSAALVLTVMVLLGGMLTYAVTLTSGVHSGSAQELMQARALQAARAGLEWGRYRIRVGAASCAALTNISIPLSSSTPPLTMPVTVRCTLTGTHTEVTTVVNTYQLSANACSPAGPGGLCPNPAGSTDYVEQQVEGRVDR